MPEHYVITVERDDRGFWEVGCACGNITPAHDVVAPAIDDHADHVFRARSYPEAVSHAT